MPGTWQALNRNQRKIGTGLNVAPSEECGEIQEGFCIRKRLETPHLARPQGWATPGTWLSPLQVTSTAGHEHRVSGASAPADGPGAPGRWHLLAGSLPSSTSWSSVSTRMMLGRMFLRSLWNRPFRRWCDRKAELPPSRGRTEAESRHSRRPGRAILRFCWSVASGGRQESGAAPGGLASLPSSLSTHGPKGAGSEAGQSFCTAATAQTCIMRRTMASGTDKDSLSDGAALAKQTSNTAQVTSYLQSAQATGRWGSLQ